MKSRPRVSIYIAASLDGYIARENHGLDWLDRVGGFDEDYGFQQFLSGVDGLIIGRKTYDIASTVPDPYPGKRVVVLSNTLKSVAAGMELYSGELDDLLHRMQRQGIRHIWVDGGTTLSQFLAAGWVDAMTVSMIPVILGSGLPLFSRVGKEIPCRLLSAQSYPSGLVQLQYEIIRRFSEAKDKIDLKIVSFGSDAYKKSVDLREEILRKPLGLRFTPQEWDLEKEHVHIVAYLGQELCGCAVLAPSGDRFKMQRMSVKLSFQNKGIGSLIVSFCEKYAAGQGGKSVFCHAREKAIPFYLKNGYLPEGRPFNEDGISHLLMVKPI